VPAKLEVNDNVYELREAGPHCSRVFMNGVELKQYRWMYEGVRATKKGGHVGEPTADMMQEYLREVHRNVTKGRA